MNNLIQEYTDAKKVLIDTEESIRNIVYAVTPILNNHSFHYSYEELNSIEIDNQEVVVYMEYSTFRIPLEVWDCDDPVLAARKYVLLQKVNEKVKELNILDKQLRELNNAL